MKKLLFTLTISVVSLALFAQQGIEQNCITCDNNTVELRNGASALGTQNISTGINSFAVGKENQALGDYSIAMPLVAKAIGQRSVAIGYLSNANANQSISLGSYSHTKANAILSVAIGSYVSTQNKYSFVMGFGSADTLKNNIEKSLMIGFNSNLPTLFVSPSSGSGTTGKIGIGNITDSEYKLHILSDVGEAAELKLEYRTTGSKQFAKIHLGDYSIRGGIDGGIQGFVFTTPSFRHFVFQNGTLRSINGSAAAPAYSFSESPGTGMFRPPSANTIAFSTGGQERVRISSSGNVGIGTTDPGNTTLSLSKEVTSGYSYVHLIKVSGSSNNVNTTKALAIKANGIDDAFLVLGSGIIRTKGDELHFNQNTSSTSTINSNVPIRFKVGGDEMMRITENGNIAIGATTPGDYKLAVKGNIRAEEVVVELMDSWPDYVFEADYPLMQLDELQSFISENNHLPDVPNARQISEEGISLGEMNALLLKKVEELTLYILKQDKRLSELETMITGKAD